MEFCKLMLFDSPARLRRSKFNWNFENLFFLIRLCLDGKSLLISTTIIPMNKIFSIYWVQYLMAKWLWSEIITIKILVLLKLVSMLSIWYLHMQCNIICDESIMESSTRWTFISAHTSLDNKEVLTYLEQAWNRTGNTGGRARQPSPLPTLPTNARF